MGKVEGGRWKVEGAPGPRAQFRRAQHFQLSTFNFSLTGLTLIEVAIATAILSIAFVGLYQVFQISVRYTASARTREAALTLAQERVEQLRAAGYANIDIGTETELLTQNGVSLLRTTIAAYVDDSADGTSGSDSDSNTNDYKKATVFVAWSSTSGTSTMSLTSNFVP